MLEICSDLFKTGLKINILFLSTFKKWPNGQTILFLANSLKKGQIGQIWPLKRPNGNPGQALGFTFCPQHSRLYHNMYLHSTTI
jgi:hypothetical protein